MDAGAAKTALLYASDDGGNVFVFSYPGGVLMGTLSAFSSPGGLCSDSRGDVFITDTEAEKIFEYKHGATKPVATLLDFGDSPQGCAFDEITGNLAVTNYSSSPLGPGSVAIYAGAQGSPVKYQDPNVQSYLFCGYDNAGNLYADGINAGTTAAKFDVLPSGGSELHPLTLNHPIGFPGGVQWDGTYLAIEDLRTASLDRFSVSGSQGTLAGTTQLTASSKLVVQFWIDAGSVIVPYGTRTRRVKRVGVWAYPAGGSPSNVFPRVGATELIGTTVSASK